MSRTRRQKLQVAKEAAAVAFSGLGRQIREYLEFMQIRTVPQLFVLAIFAVGINYVAAWIGVGEQFAAVVSILYILSGSASFIHNRLNTGSTEEHRRDPV